MKTIALSALATFMAAWAIWLMMAIATSQTHSSPVRCVEDMPCWDCTTMGNRICGPGH